MLGVLTALLAEQAVGPKAALAGLAFAKSWPPGSDQMVRTPLTEKGSELGRGIGSKGGQ